MWARDVASCHIRVWPHMPPQNCDATHSRGAWTVVAQCAPLLRTAGWAQGRGGHSRRLCWHSARRGATAGRAGTARAVGAQPDVTTSDIPVTAPTQVLGAQKAADTV